MALFGFGKKRSSPDAGAAGGGSNLASIEHDEPVEVHLSGGARRTLRQEGKRLKSVPVADVAQSVAEVRDLLRDELVKVEFSGVDKKPEAVLLANELAVMTGAAVAEVVGNVALLYHPPPSGTRAKYRI